MSAEKDEHLAGTAAVTAWTIPEPVVPIDDAGARAAIRRVADEAGALLNGVDDVGAPVPGSDWTVREAAAHLVTVFRAFAASIEGRLDDWGAPEGDAVARAIMEVEDSGNPRALAGHLEDAVQAFLTAAAGRSPDEIMGTPWYDRDRTHLVGAMTCLVLGEAVVHGYDLAQAVGRPWPIEADDARLIISGVFPAKVGVVADPEATTDVDVTYELRVDGGPAFALRFADGTGVAGPAGSWPAHCLLEGDPVAIVLWVYGRTASEELFASGRVRASGPDPSLGPRFKRFLRNP